MNILFLCKYNRFRSKLAEAYFNKVNDNSNFVVRSAGLIFDSSPSNVVEIGTARENGLTFSKGFQGMSTDLWDWADKLIIVADTALCSAPLMKNASPAITSIIIIRSGDVVVSTDGNSTFTADVRKIPFE